MRFIDQMGNGINHSALREGDLIFISRKKPSIVWQDEYRIFIRLADYRVHHVSLSEDRPYSSDDNTKDDSRDIEYIRLIASGTHYPKHLLRDLTSAYSRLKMQLDKIEKKIVALSSGLPGKDVKKL